MDLKNFLFLWIVIELMEVDFENPNDIQIVKNIPYFYMIPNHFGTQFSKIFLHAKRGVEGSGAATSWTEAKPHMGTRAQRAKVPVDRRGL